MSLVVALIISVYLSKSGLENKDMEQLSKLINKNLQISSIYSVTKQKAEKSIYMGKIKIPKIDLDYTIYSSLTEEQLKIAPCRFYGVDMGEEGNICIAGHNYNDNRFFGKLNKLNIKDEIIIIDLENKEYLYTVFNIYETNENDLSCLKNSKQYELTLITCNNANKKRLVVKALIKNEPT